VSLAEDMKDELPPGSYSLRYNMKTGILYFDKLVFKNDSILDLPSPEYSDVVNQLKYFMSNEVKTKMKSLGYLYKRSALLHGKPGTGKTVIVNKVVNDMIQLGGICLFAEQVALVKLALSHIDKTQPNTMVAVVLEEVDSLIKWEEKELLYLLDGQLQRENIMYLATTNYFDRIPDRLKRPGRFGIIRKVNTPIPEARAMYIKSKLGSDFRDLNSWVDKTEGLTIDELKEVVQAVYIFKQDIDRTVGLLKQLSSNTATTNYPNEDEDDEYEKKEQLREMRDQLDELVKSTVQK
jgi:SpoVK/Ycf46/Vps4 family AAA+-type ATPase